MNKNASKRIIILTSLFILLRPITTNALYTEIDKNITEFQELLNGYTVLERCHLFDYSNSYSMVCVNSLGTQFFGIKSIDNDIAVFNLNDGTALDEVNAALKKEFNEYYGIVQYPYGTEYAYQLSLNTKQAKEVCAFLKEQNMVDSFVYLKDRHSITKFYIPYLLTYSIEDKKSLENYIVMMGKDYQLIEKSIDPESGELTDILENAEELRVCIIPKSEKTVSELADFAERIYDETGVTIAATSPVSITEEYASSIDIFNFVPGDANCDEKATVADSVAILQSIANNDKYALSAQGKFNGDISGDYDGITSADARILQEWDANK